MSRINPRVLMMIVMAIAIAAIALANLIFAAGCHSATPARAAMHAVVGVDATAADHASAARDRPL